MITVIKTNIIFLLTASLRVKGASLVRGVRGLAVDGFSLVTGKYDQYFIFRF